MLGLGYMGSQVGEVESYLFSQHCTTPRAKQGKATKASNPRLQDAENIHTMYFLVLGCLNLGFVQGNHVCLTTKLYPKSPK